MPLNRGIADVSVIIPAFNSAGTLVRTLDALAGQDLDRDYEVIVVDDGSDDGTQEVVESAPGPVALVSQDRQGAAHARNVGAAAARGSVLAFTDADCFPTPGWLSAGLEAMQALDLAQGAVEADPSASRGPFDRSLWVVGEVGLYEAANLFVARDAFERVGGFQEWVKPDGKHFGEDVWFGWKARRSGARTGFRADTLVYHAVFPRRASDYIAERKRLAFFADIAAKIPEIRQELFYRRWFLTRRTAAFDLGVVSVVSAAATASALPLIGAAPYMYLVLGQALRWRTHALEVAGVNLVADATGCLALLRGSVRRRTLVL